MKVSLAIAALAAATILAPQAAAQTGAVIVGKGPGVAGAAQTVKVTATITAIDAATRDITLKGPQGREVVVTAGPEVRNFAQMKVGDQVDVEYVEALTLELKKGGGQPVAKTETAGMARAKPGEQPSPETPMLDRRRFLAVLPALGLASRAGATTATVAECAVFTPARQQATSPDDALRLLVEGNERFVAGQTVNCDLRAQVRQTADGQAPFAAIVGCIDSRVPPELVFDQRIGDVFCARIAGNFVNADILGSLEFSTKLSGARPSSCSAIPNAAPSRARSTARSSAT